ncbi:MPND family protein [Megaselia abdita]
MCLQLHSLSTDYSVTGFIGGKRYYKDGKLWLYLLRYKPCETEQQSRMCCEIPLISEVKETSGALQSEGFELLGWFHSHPQYTRKPSKNDVQTQKDIQLNSKSGPDRPLVGLIFSCLDMKMRCIYIHPKDLMSEGLIKPFDMEVAITKEHKHFPIHVESVLSAIKDKEFEIKQIVRKVGLLFVYLVF